MPTLDNGGWVPDDHPLYLDEQKKKNSQLGAAQAADPTATQYKSETSAVQPIADYSSTADYDPQQAAAAGLSWAPKGHPLYGTAGFVGYNGAAAAPAAADPYPVPATGQWDGGTGMTPDQAAAAGLAWAPKGHPLYGTPGFVGSTPAGAGAAAGASGAAGSSYIPPNAAPGTPGANALDTQTSNAQTYSQTPGAAPSNATTNQGTQDAVRNTYLQQLQKGTHVDTNDPNFRMQSDAFAAAQERARRNQLDDSAQASFAGHTLGSGGDNVERRMMDEASARNVGQFEGALVGKELESRRDEIKNALASLGGMIGDDQKLALNRELAALDAAIKREGIASQGQIAAGQLGLGGQELAIKDKLGTGALNIDLLRAMLQNQQFGTSAGIQMGDLEAKYSGLF